MNVKTARLFFILIAAHLATGASALDYFWVGDAGNWSDYANHWATTSGGVVFHPQVPTSVDDIYFDANSFSAAAQTVNIDETIIYCKNMDWTAANNPILNGAAGNELKIFGSLTFIAAMNLSFTGKIHFSSNAAGKTITTAGQIFKEDIYFDGAGGGWTLQDALNGFSPDYDGIYLENGTLNTNGQYVKCGKMWSTGNNVRGLTLGSSTVDIGSNVIAGWWYISGANMTMNSGTSTINAIGNGTTLNFRAGSKTYYTLNCLADITDMRNNNTFSNLLSIAAGKALELFAGSTQTLGGSLVANGNCVGGITIRSSSSGTAATFSKAAGIVTVDYVTLSDNNAIGGASYTANNSVDGGGNSGWTINIAAPKNFYWISNAGNWSDVNHWSLSSGGPPAGCLPTSIDDVFFDNLSFSLAGQTATVNIPNAYCNSMTWTGATGTPALGGPSANNLNIFGSLTFIAAMNLSFTGKIHFSSNAAGKTITTAGQIFKEDIYFDGAGGGWTLQDALNGFSPDYDGIYLENGTLNTNGQYVKCGKMWSTGNNVRGLTLGSSTVDIGSNVIAGWWYISGANMTMNSGTSTINAIGNGTTLNFRAGSKTYYTLNCLADITDIRDNNTFNFELSLTPGTTLRLLAGSTQTLGGNLDAIGTAGFPIEILTTVNGSAATLFKTSGIVCCQYLELSDNTAAGGATFYADNSVDVTNNTGWLFTGCIILPVELLSFTATPVNNESVLLEWTTASENFNDHFVVERSTDGDRWETNGQVDGTGNSVTILNYNYEDNKPNKGINYYRLMPVDNDGNFEYSSVETAFISPANELFVSTYPNPVKAGENIFINYNLTSDQIVTVQLSDITGKVILDQQSLGMEGDNQLTINTRDFSNGLYLLRLTTGELHKVEKIAIN